MSPDSYAHKHDADQGHRIPNLSALRKFENEKIHLYNFLVIVHVHVHVYKIYQALCMCMYMNTQTMMTYTCL